MKTIHWKLSSCAAQMLTKLFETSGDPGLDLVLDLNMPKLSPNALMGLFDTSVELALSVRKFGADYAYSTDLYFYDESGDLTALRGGKELDYWELIADVGISLYIVEDGEDVEELHFE